jgi:hypothetical protein
MMLDKAGTPRWTRDHNGGKGLDDKAMAAAFDSKGRLVVAGYEDGDASQASPYDAGDWAVRLYSAEGKELKKLGPGELKTAPGAAFALVLRGSEVLLAGFEQGEDIGNTRWLCKKAEGLE